LKKSRDMYIRDVFHIFANTIWVTLKTPC